MPRLVFGLVGVGLLVVLLSWYLSSQTMTAGLEHERSGASQGEAAEARNALEIATRGRERVDAVTAGHKGEETPSGH